MPDILANPNALPARADMQVRSDGILDLANFVAEVVPAGRRSARIRHAAP